MDRLPWSRWHWLVVVGLGTVWILDGLEVIIVGSLSDALEPEGTGLGLSNFDIGLAGAVYVAGACAGTVWPRSATGAGTVWPRLRRVLPLSYVGPQETELEESCGTRSSYGVPRSAWPANAPAASRVEPPMRDASRRSRRADC
jgi:hypothetical protein